MTFVPGFYGKLPGRGDFVSSGWNESMVEAFDHWLADGLAAWRPIDDADFSAHFAAVPLYGFYLPAGMVGDMAVHGVLSPSVDRAGRYFFLVAGIAGPAAAVWHIAAHDDAFASAASEAIYAALGPDSDPDALGTALAAAVPDVPQISWRAALATPAKAIFWAEGEGDPLIITSVAFDGRLLGAVLNVTPFTGGVA